MKRILSFLLVLTLIFGACSMTACELFEGWFNKDTPPTPSEGLEFKLSTVGDEFAVAGIGNCGDLDIVIPDTYEGKPVTAIAAEAFYEENIKSVYIPSSVKSIGICSFAKCEELERVTMHDGIEAISYGAFMMCTSLVEIAIPKGVTAIADATFTLCTSLKSVTLHENIKYIGEGAFAFCVSLEKLSVPGGIDVVSCFNLGQYMNSVKSYEVLGESDHIKVRDGNLYADIIDGNSYTYFLGYAMGKTDKAFTVPGDVDVITEFAFSFCPYRVDDIFSTKEPELQSSAALERVVISEGVSQILGNAFIHLAGLKSVVIPKSVTSLPANVFYNCMDLEVIEYSGTTEEWKNIEKADEWYWNCPIKQVKCSNGSVCPHAYKANWTVVKQPSATETGLARRTCSLCGETQEKVLEMQKTAVVLWVSTVECIKEFTEEQIEVFMTRHPEYSNYSVTIYTVGEGDAANEVLADLATAPDIYCFAQDQLIRLVQAGALAPLSQSASATVKSDNDAGSVNAASVADKLYAYPMTSDNGYFLYYDASVVSDEEAKTLEGIIAACERAGKKFGYNLSNGWIMSSFFFAQSVDSGEPICESSWTFDAAGRYPLAYEDTFNSANGLIAMKAMQRLASSSAFTDTSDNFYGTGAVVTGIWNSYTAEAAYGENWRAAKLPTYTVDGQEYQLGSFSGYKLMGCKPQQDENKAKFCQDLALYLTSEECQLERYYEFQWGPSNVNAQANEDVKANISLSALLEQNVYAHPQGIIPADWWWIASCLGVAAEAAESDADLVAALESYQAEIDKLVE